MERDVMDIIMEKEFIELNPSERAELEDLCSTEEEFNQMKSMFAGMNAMNWSNPKPKAETKERLDVLFQQTHPKVAPIWYNAPLAILLPKGKPFYRQPLVQLAAVALLVLIAYPMVNSNVMESENMQVAEVQKLKEVDSTKELRNTAKVEEKQDQKQDQKHDVLNSEASEQHSPIEQEVVVRNKAARGQIISPTVVSGSFSTAPSAPIVLRETEAIDFAVAEEMRDNATQPGSSHPDGIFMSDRAELFSVPASRQPAVFDLLTSTF